MSAAFSFSASNFAGPLEALLDLIEARKMPVSEVSLSEVTDSYLKYLESLPSLPLPETSQFILIASTLLLIKSRSLLPTFAVTEEEKESVEELERRLKRLRIIRAVAKLLRREWGRASLVLAQRAPEKPPVFSPDDTNVQGIYSSLMRLVATIPKPEKRHQHTVAPVLALEDVIVRLRTRLTSALRTRFSDVVRNAADKGEVIVYFLAMLELVRSGSASVTQNKLFDDIMIETEQITTPSYGV
jgi:segregation and condensation protein A